MELRDGDAARYKGKGVEKAVQAVNAELNSELGWLGTPRTSPPSTPR